MDAGTGQVLYERRPDRHLPPASTTKIVTAIVALEKRKLQDRLRVTRSATRVSRLRMGLRRGQTITVQDLLYGALLYSANDAAMVLAEGIAGSVPDFAKMMTLKAHMIGAKNSHFVNPHGLTARGHYSTARDMALIFNYAMGNPDFQKIVQTKRTSVHAISSGKRKRVKRIPLRNKNRLLWNFDGAIGGKTGYTRAARRCFVGGASRDGVTLIVSVLGSRNLWGDTRRLLEYGFRKHNSLADVSVVSPPSPRAEQVIPSQENHPPAVLSLTEESRNHASYGYFLQIGSFREKDRAESLQKRIILEGYRAFLEHTPLNGEATTYRVKVGPYRHLIQAEKAARQIESRKGFKAIVLTPPTPSGPAESAQ